MTHYSTGQQSIVSKNVARANQYLGEPSVMQTVTWHLSKQLSIWQDLMSTPFPRREIQENVLARIVHLLNTCKTK